MMVRLLTLAVILTAVYADVDFKSSETKADIVAVKCDSSEGPFRIVVNSRWASIGVAWFLKMVGQGFFTNMPVHRNTPDLLQFGISADTEMHKKWDELTYLAADPNNNFLYKEGMVSFACDRKLTEEINERSSKIWVATSGKKAILEKHGTDPCEVPIGLVTQGLERMKKLSAGVGEVQEYGNPEGISMENLAKNGTKALKGVKKVGYIRGCSETKATVKDRKAVATRNWPIRPKEEKTVTNVKKNETKEEPKTIKIALVNNLEVPLELFGTIGENAKASASKWSIGTIQSGQMIEDDTYVGHRYHWLTADGEEVKTHVIKQEIDMLEDLDLMFNGQTRFYFAGDTPAVPKAKAETQKARVPKHNEL